MNLRIWTPPDRCIVFVWGEKKVIRPCHFRHVAQEITEQTTISVSATVSLRYTSRIRIHIPTGRPRPKRWGPRASFYVIGYLSIRGTYGYDGPKNAVTCDVVNIIMNRKLPLVHDIAMVVSKYFDGHEYLSLSPPQRFPNIRSNWCKMGKIPPCASDIMWRLSRRHGLVLVPDVGR